MFRLQHFPFAGGSESTFRGTAISLTHFQVYYFHCTLLARPVGSSALCEHFLGHTSIPLQTDMTERKKGCIYGVGKAEEHIFMQLPRKAILFFHTSWEKDSKKEGVAKAFSRKKQHFLHQAH